MPTTVNEVYALKLWILSGCLGVTILVLGYFLKRIFDGFDARAAELEARIQRNKDLLAEHHVKLVQCVAHVSFVDDRLDSLEAKIDNTWLKMQ